MIVATFAAWHARDHRLAQVVQYRGESGPKAKRAEIQAVQQRFDDFIEAGLEAGVTTRSLTAPDVAGATLAILSLCIDVARWYSPSEQRSPGEASHPLRRPESAHARRHPA